MAADLFAFGLSAEQLNAVAASVTAGVAFVALCVAIWQVSVTKREARLTLAKSLYKDYLALAMQNPCFSSPSYPKSAPRLKEFSTDRDKYEQYEFFVSYLLFAAEEILDLVGTSSPEWHATLASQLRYHALYLQSADLQESHLSKAVLRLRDRALIEYESEPLDA